MSLQAAKWVVVAKGYLDRDDNVEGLTTVRCRVGRAGSWDRMALVLPPDIAGSDYQPFVMLWSGAFTARSIVALQCRVPADASVKMKWLKLTAYRAGTLAAYSLD
jgi:hypothetical protein